MPIRFRCAYCNQLLGIARRKSGQVVRCPTCAGQVVVPQVEGDEPEPSPPPITGGAAQPAYQAPAPPLFERSDFDNLLNEPVLEIIDDNGYQHPAAAPAPERPRQVAAPPPPPSLKFDVEPINTPARQPPPGAGILISPLTATILTVTWILSLGVTFGLGWFIGTLR